MDDDMFDQELFEGLPDDFEVELVEERLYWYSEDYDEKVQAFQNHVADTIAEKDNVYDVRFQTSFDDGYAFREAWILYGGGENG
ncbi:MAG: hypothetical protein SVU32_07340 [Candidatus Nanohaloarchaea archaeon]|nr:hypothetical protein [Candidatus Nanohaloarchaea archaeon]